MEHNEASPGNSVTLEGFWAVHWRKLLAWFWAAMGLLLIIAFFLPNFRIATLEKNGIDMVSLAFEDTSHIRQMTSEGGYLLMVAVPVCYLALGIAAIVAAVRAYLGKSDLLTMMVTGAALVVMVMTIVGLSVIGSGGGDVFFIAKFQPKPTYGYHLALFWETLLLLTGVLHQIMLMQKAKAVAS